MKEMFEWRWLRQFHAWVLLLAASILGSPAQAAVDFLESGDAFRLTVQEQGPGQVELPRGETKEDPNFGTVEVYHDAVQVQIATGNAKSPRVTWQGCAEDGLCYPPEEKDIALAMAGQGGSTRVHCTRDHCGMGIASTGNAGRQRCRVQPHAEAALPGLVPAAVLRAGHMGPPTLMLYGPQGQERRDQRLVGELGPEALPDRLQPGRAGS